MKARRLAESLTCGLIFTAMIIGCFPLPGAETMTYTIDRLGRLSRVAHSDGTVIDYVYDLNGNRLRKVVSGPSLDQDADGLPDTWEIANFGSTQVVATADPDADGMTNLQEFIAKTDPNNSGSALRIQSLSLNGTGISVTWKSTSGVRYRILFRENLTTSPWIELTSGLTAASDETTYQNPNPMLQPSGFFRVEVIP
jgi:YD repeat-containing protein